MTLATASTTTKAMPRHGGGLVHPENAQQQAGGRLQLVTGGEIKSLCCAAAGNIPAPLQAHTPRVYPTTCVRRAADQRESLRSTNRPHAQLVVGYGQLDRAQNAQLRSTQYAPTLQIRCGQTDLLVVELYQLQPSAITLRACRQTINFNTHQAPSLHSLLQMNHVMQQCSRPQVGGGDVVQQRPINWPLGGVTTIYIRLDRSLYEAKKGFAWSPWGIRPNSRSCEPSHLILYCWILYQLPGKHLICKIQFISKVVGHRQEKLLSPGCFAPLLHSGMPVGEECGPSYSQNRTECLYPPRCIRRQPPMLHPISNRADKKPQHRSADQQPPHRPKRAFDHLLGSLQSLHSIWLLAIKPAASLPTLSSAVHGGAA